MSLPQRKKSAEEIAKLRESLGIPGAAAEDGVSPADFSPASHPTESAPAASIPDAVMSAARWSEPPPPPAVPPVMEEPPSSDDHRPVVRVLAVDSDDDPVQPVVKPQLLAPEPTDQAPLPSAGPVKQVRSLRKSEQGPVARPHRAPADSPLPAHRHSDGEIKAIRKQEALAPHPSIPHPATLAAHPMVFIPAYLFAFTGGGLAFYFDLAMAWPAACEAIALAVAVYIYLNKPLSRHHGAFIAVLALLVLVFGAIHYFPNLKYGT